MESDSGEISQHGARKKPAGDMAKPDGMARQPGQDLNQVAELL
jgi:hypothetical protein